MTRTDVHASAEALAREQFAGHEMTVLLDQGVYRHLRFRAPGTSVYGFDLVTWPGHLAISGDIGDFVFARLNDMVDFFAGDAKRGTVNVDYWAEKLQAPRRDGVLEWSPARYRQQVGEWLEGRIEWADESDDMVGLAAAVEEDLLGLGRFPESLHEAHERLRDFDFEHQRVDDSWEWDMRDYTHTFLVCCWAISVGIGKYVATRQRLAGAAHGGAS